jgi:hypothetical protein
MNPQGIIEHLQQALDQALAVQKAKSDQALAVQKAESDQALPVQKAEESGLRDDAHQATVCESDHSFG